jgi:hypothetical protein
MNEQDLQELIDEMKARSLEFERYSGQLGMNEHYWNGKKSEAAIVVEKLEWIKAGKPEN